MIPIQANKLNGINTCKNASRQNIIMPISALNADSSDRQGRNVETSKPTLTVYTQQPSIENSSKKSHDKLYQSSDNRKSQINLQIPKLPLNTHDDYNHTMLGKGRKNSNIFKNILLNDQKQENFLDRKNNKKHERL